LALTSFPNRPSPGWPLALQLAVVALILSGCALPLLGLTFLLGSVLWGFAFLLAPPLFLGGMSLGWWGKTLCQRNPELPGLRMSLTAVALGYIGLWGWYLLQIGIWLHHFPAVALDGLFAVALLGVILLFADGSRAAFVTGSLLVLFTTLASVGAAWVIQTRENARRANIIRELHNMAVEHQNLQKQNPGGHDRHAAE